MKVSLISYTSFPQNMVAKAAKLCYSKNIDPMEKISESKAGEFVKMLVDMRHESPIEHVSFTFFVQDVSRALLAQITRHRIASFSVKSQRYVTEEDFSFVIPPSIKANEECSNIFLEFIEYSKKCYCKILKLLEQGHMKSFKCDSEEEKLRLKRKALKDAAQDARFLLPNACTTSFIFTMNARSLLNFFRLRCCLRAQWEINDLAVKMLGLVYKIAPAIFEKAGPCCLYDKCSQGKMCCGNMEKIREKIENIKNEEI